MKTYKITPLCMGYITRPRKNFFYTYSGTEVEPFPVNAFYLEGEHKILVDNGGSDPESTYGRKTQPYTRTTDQEIVNALKNIGVEPEEIEYIIFTHLHWDHASNTHYFPHAKLICQKREIESLYEEGNPSNEKGYDMDYVKQFTYQTVEGDKELFDGISVVYTPGHTIGSQSVVVNTNDGPVIITGDLVTIRASWEHDPPMPNGLYYNEDALRMMFESIDKIRKISDTIYAGHDPELY